MLQRGQQSFASAAETIKELDEEYKKHTSTVEKDIILRKRQALEEQARIVGISKAAEQATIGLMKIASAGMSGAGQFIKGLQSGGSGIELATGLIQTSLTMAGEGSRAAGDAVGTLGGTLAMSANPKLKALGIAASIAGPAIGMLGEKASQLAKFGVEILSKEVEKTVKAFHDVTGSGAIMGRGMDDIRFYANRAGLTVDQFAEVVKGNSGSLAEAGYTVAEGAKIVGNVTSQFSKLTGKSGLSLQREMQNLGFGFKEQADLAAQAAANIRKTGGTATNEQVARATMDMAKNMRIVSDIMGEDAKAKMDAAKKQAEQYAFDKKIREIAKRTGDVGLANRVTASLALMDETQRRAAIQATVLGGAVTDVSANVLGQADAGREFAARLEQGNASLQDLTGGFARSSQNFDQQYGATAQAISTAAIAGASGLNELGQAATSLGQQQFKLTADNLDRASKAADQLAGATGKMQDGVMGAEKAAQDLKVTLEKELTPAVAQFAKVSKAMLGEVQQMLDKAGIGKTAEEKKDQGQSWLGKIWDAVKEKQVISKGLMTGGAVVEVAGLAADVTGVGAVAGIPLNVIGGVMMGVGKLADMLGFAKGGITKEPAIFGEAGPEAAVPLPDGKSIPVTLSGTKGLEDAMSGKNQGPATINLSGLDPTKNKGPTSTDITEAAFDEVVKMTQGFFQLSGTLKTMSKLTDDDGGKNTYSYTDPAVTKMMDNMTQQMGDVKSQLVKIGIPLTYLEEQAGKGDMAQGDYVTMMTKAAGNLLNSTAGVPMSAGLADAVVKIPAFSDAVNNMKNPNESLIAALGDHFDKMMDKIQDKNVSTGGGTSKTESLMSDLKDLMTSQLTKHDEMINQMSQTNDINGRLLNAAYQ